MSLMAEKFLRKLPDPRTIFPSLDTPYCKYRNTKYIAQGGDILAIREILYQRQQQLHDLDTIINGTEDLLGQLREKRDQIISSRMMHNAFIRSSNIHRLPSNILKLIFEQCLPEDMFITPDTETAPLLLTRICRRWRAIVLDTPELWRSLCVLPSRGPLEQDLGFYRQWLSKAGGCPLSLELGLPPTLDEVRDALIQFVRHYTSRCTELRIDDFQPVELALLLNDVPALKHLALSGDINAMRNTPTITIVQPKPHLRTLTIFSVTFDVDILSTFNPGWANLTHLSVTLESDWDHYIHPIFLALLQVCTNLEHLAFNPFCLRSDDAVSITHPKLCSLEISELHREGSFLDTLTFPNLRNLQIVPSRDHKVLPFDGTQIILDEDETGMSYLQKTSTIPPHARICNIFLHEDLIPDTQALLNTFNPGWTNLTHLKVKLVHREDIFSKFLELCPNLEDFTFYDLTIMGPEFPTSPPMSCTHPRLRSLTIGILFDLEGQFLGMMTLPNLRYLCLDFRSLASWPHNEFKNFLSRSRCPLETLDICGLEGFEAEERDEVAMLVPTLNIYHRDDE